MPYTRKQDLRIAVIGSGIAGLASAWLLSRKHRVTLFEAGDYFGGHSHTVDVSVDGFTHPVDTGFLVFNDHTYPNLIALFKALGIESHDSDMSFSVSVDHGRLEWAGTNLATLFAQPANLLRPQFIRMVRDILRFNRMAKGYLDVHHYSTTTLGELLETEGYSDAFRNWYLLPMAAAIWSSPFGEILNFPVATFLNFCINHGLCQINNRPRWRTVKNGSRNYVEKMLPAIQDARLDCAVSAVQRLESGGVRVSSKTGDEVFDVAIMACHAPQSMALLRDASHDERQMLAGVRYQKNTAYLHTDAALLPKRKLAWSAWNCLTQRSDDGGQPVCVSYLINRLQPLPFTTPVVCTLNPVVRPDKEKILGVFEYDHPLFDQAALAAQRRLHAIQGKNQIWFAGAWTRYGFHEDGLRSALKVAADFGCLPDWAVLED